MALRHVKLFSCFIAPLSDDMLVAGSGNRRLLAQLVRCYRAAVGAASPKDEAAVLAVSVESLRLWRNGETVLSLDRMQRNIRRARDRAAEEWSRRLAPGSPQARDAKDAIERLGQFLAALDSESPESVYDVATRVLGLGGHTEVQRCIDEVIYRDRPLLPSCWFDLSADSPNRDRDDKLLRTLLGHHAFYLRRQNPLRWLLAPARVRYRVANEHGQGFIRFKMAIPDSRGDAGVGKGAHDVDGAVTDTGSFLFFLAESRGELRQDHLYMVCPRLVTLGDSDQFWSLGKYLTIDQNTLQPVSEDFVVRRHKRPSREALAALVADEDPAFMASHRVLRSDSTDPALKAEFRQIEDVYRRLQAGGQDPTADGPSARAAARRVRRG